MENKSIHEIISTTFKALSLAMGVAVVVLSCLGSLDTKTGCYAAWHWPFLCGCSPAGEKVMAMFGRKL